MDHFQPSRKMVFFGSHFKFSKGVNPPLPMGKSPKFVLVFSEISQHQSFMCYFSIFS